MRSRLVKVASLLSFVLCLLLIGAWVRSYFVFDTIAWTTATKEMRWVAGHPTAKLVKVTAAKDVALRWDVLSSGGCIGVGRHYSGALNEADRPLVQMGWQWKREDAPGNLFGVTDTWHERLGFYYYTAQWRIHDGPMENRYSGWMWLLDDKVIALPYWMLVLVTGLAPGWWSVGWLQKQKRARTNRCSTCGYDLRATPERCPECGTVRKKRAARRVNKPSA